MPKMQKIYLEMKLFRLLSIACCMAAIFLSGCTPLIYGIPQPEWQKFTDSQKQEAIRRYNERERMREQVRILEAERLAKEAEIRAAEARRQQELMQSRIEGIYRGEEGQYGDLIRVTIQGGQMQAGGRHQMYQPVALKLANSEVRRVEIISLYPRYPAIREELVVSYRDGALLVDANIDSSGRATSLVYDSSWKNGNSYLVNSYGNLQLRNVRVGVEIIPPLLRKEKY